MSGYHHLESAPFQHLDLEPHLSQRLCDIYDWASFSSAHGKAVDVPEEQPTSCRDETHSTILAGFRSAKYVEAAEGL